MRVGSGKCEMIFPESFFPTEGFTVQAHPLFVRAVVLGAAKPVVLVSIEMTSLPDDEAGRLRNTAAASAATRLENVWITVTHTFSAPHLLPDALLDEAGMARKKQLRAMLDEVNPSCHLEVDGGVDLKTGVVCKENGANVLVAGSAYFKAEDKAAFVKLIQS